MVTAPRAHHVALLVAISLAFAPRAHASFPGANGPIAYVAQVHGEQVIKSAFLGPEDILHNETLLSSIGGGGENAFDPAWDQSGRELAFTSDRSGRNQLYSSEPACSSSSGCPVRRLLSDSANDREASWAPPGRGNESLAFTSDRSGTPQIYKLTLTRGRPPAIVRLTFDQAHDSEAKWSSTGQIAFVSDRSGTPQIYSMNSSNGEVHQVTHTVFADSGPAWSPDGKELSYTSLTEKEGSQVFTVKASGAEPRRITTAVTETLSSVWSPDGKLILVNFKADSAGEFALEAIDTAGTPVSPLYLGARMDSDWAVLPAPRHRPTAGLTAIVEPAGGRATINPTPATPGQTLQNAPPGSEETAIGADEQLASQLTAPVEAPVNSTYDVTHGEVKLRMVSSTESNQPTAGGSRQPVTALVKGGRFELLQHAAEAAPTIRLLGRAHGCGHRRGHGRALSATRHGYQPSVRVKSKGRMHGIAKTGNLGTKATEWEMRETCRGTLYTVYRHAALVTDPRRKRTVVVRAGHSYLVRSGR